MLQRLVFSAKIFEVSCFMPSQSPFYLVTRVVEQLEQVQTLGLPRWWTCGDTFGQWQFVYSIWCQWRSPTMIINKSNAGPNLRNYSCIPGFPGVFLSSPNLVTPRWTLTLVLFNKISKTPNHSHVRGLKVGTKSEISLDLLWTAVWIHINQCKEQYSQGSE